LTIFTSCIFILFFTFHFKLIVDYEKQKTSYNYEYNYFIVNVKFHFFLEKTF
jgi:hypothetical protein